MGSKVGHRGTGPVVAWISRPLFVSIHNSFLTFPKMGKAQPKWCSHWAKRMNSLGRTGKNQNKGNRIWWLAFIWWKWRQIEGTESIKFPPNLLANLNLLPSKKAINPVATSEYSCGRSVYLHLAELPPGRYLLIPSTFAPREEAEFMLRIYSSNPKLNPIELAEDIPINGQSIHCFWHKIINQLF